MVTVVTPHISVAPHVSVESVPHVSVPHAVEEVPEIHAAPVNPVPYVANTMLLNSAANSAHSSLAEAQTASSVQSVPNDEIPFLYSTVGQVSVFGFIVIGLVACLIYAIKKGTK